MFPPTDDPRARAWFTFAAGLLIMVLAGAIDRVLVSRTGGSLQAGTWLMAGVGVGTVAVGVFKLLMPR